MVANARRLLRSVRSETDVVQLGDSMLSWCHPDDDDQRLFPQMVRESLGHRHYVSVHGPGYHMGIYHRYLKMLAMQGTLPRLLIVPLTYRQCAQMWSRHPRNGYAFATAKLDEFLTRGRPAWSMIARRQRKDPAAMAQFRALTHPCRWEGTKTNGEFIDLIRNGSRDDATIRHTYAYLHGEALNPRQFAVRRVEDFGRYAASLGVPVIAYENPVNVETGSSAWGEHFRAHTQRNIDIVSQALLAGAGRLGRVCRTGTTVGADSFVFPHDGIEHQRDTGRLLLAAAIVQEAASTGW